MLIYARELYCRALSSARCQPLPTSTGEILICNGIRIAGLGTLFASSVVLAQSSSDDVGGIQPLTRAEVRQQVIDLKAVGYRPEMTNNALYPNDLREAQRRLACKQNVQANGGGQAAWVQHCNVEEYHNRQSVSTLAIPLTL